ncbi:SgcJ/EcaC family oxidoreductase [Paraburkholderia sp. BR14263]|uniref:YybH family protein n=1 Tax=unclassified Paraburkholderia TaxID=2615204 RepID=UPI0034CF667B
MLTDALMVVVIELFWQWRFQMGSDERAIREMHTTWIDAVNAGDLVRLLTLMADDVVFLNPGRAPIGRERFHVGFSAAHQQSRIRCISELEEVVIVGEVAYTLCRDSLSVTPRAGGEATELAGHRMTLYRKQPDGRWLLARDANTLSPVAR